MNKASRLVAALLCFSLADASVADTIHAMQGGGYYHH